MSSASAFQHEPLFDEDSAVSSLHFPEPHVDAAKEGVRHGSRLHHSYETLPNEQENSHKSTELSLSRWVNVLAVLSAALLMDVIILTVYLYRDMVPKDSLAAATTTTTTQQECPQNATQNNASRWVPLPSADTVITSIAFGSCASQKMPQPYWDTLARFDPNVLVLTGDNVYGDCSDAECRELKQAYVDWASLPSFRGMQLPVVATLDDHDYGQGDCHADNPYKDLAKQLFLDFFDIQDERRERDGVYQSYIWGPPQQRVQLILLDTRYGRSPFLASDEPGQPGKEAYMPNTMDMDTRMLSDAQWDWLVRQFESVRAEVRIVVSSIQVLSATGFECWRMLPHELDRLERLLRAYLGESAIVLVSGDRHTGALYEKNGLLEMTASSWTHTIPFGAFNDCDSALTCDETDPHRIDDMVRVNNFGTIDIDWANRTVKLSLRRAEGTTSYHYHHESGQPTTNAGNAVQTHEFYMP